MTHVTHHAYHVEQAQVAVHIAKLNRLSHRIFVWPMPADEFLVHDDDVECASPIPLATAAAQAEVAARAVDVVSM